MNKQEAKFTSTFLAKYFKTDFITLSHYIILGNAFPLEVKYSATDSLPFSAVSEKQIRNLHEAHYGVHFSKFSDFSRIGTDYDGDVFYKSPAYIIIRYPSSVAFIAIQDWEKEERESARRSLTEKRAGEIAALIIKK